jgi:peptide/nickel transport system ATP-binding protein
VIPPDDWTGNQPAYRRFLQFKHRVLGGTLGSEDVDPATEADPVQQLLAHGLTLDVPEEHRSTPDEVSRGVDIATLDIPADARETLEAATRDVLDENHEAAIARFDGVYPSICEAEHPTMRSAGEQRAACHLYEASSGTRVSNPEPSG